METVRMEVNVYWRSISKLFETIFLYLYKKMDHQQYWSQKILNNTLHSQKSKSENGMNRSHQDFELLSEIGKEVISKLSTEKIVSTVYESINKMMDASIFVIGIYDSEKNGLDFWGIREKSETMQIGHQPLDDEKRWSVSCYIKQQEILINDNIPGRYDMMFSNRLFAESKDFRKSFIYLPLTYRQKKIGVLSIQSYVENAYTNYHFNILKNLANYITIALENADIYTKLNLQKEELVQKSTKLEEATSNLEYLVMERTKELELQKQELINKSSELESINLELKKLSVVVKETNNAIMIMDAHGNIQWINDSFTNIYEYSFDQFVNEKGKNIIQTSFNPEIINTIKSCIANKQAVTYEALNVTRTGKEIWTHTSLTPVLDEHGEIANLVTIDSDITNLKTAEREILIQQEQILKQSRILEKANFELEKLSLVAKETDNAIMIMDAEGNILWINDCFTRIYGYTFEQFIQTRGKNILQTSFNPTIKQTIEKCLSQKKSVSYEAFNIMQNGKGVWTQTTLTPVLDDDGNIKNLLTIDSDITKIKNAEKKILSQNKNIKDSIMYACKIQEALLPPTELMNSLFKEHLLLYRPKDIISGDFYWVKKVPLRKGEDKEVILITVADCTGHGVPGAFMSMLGMTLLNEVVKNATTIVPSELLNLMRTKIIKALRQTGRVGEPKDGMDVALFTIDPETLQLEYAGANNPIYITRSEPTAENPQNVNLFELKPDRMPIGIHLKEKRAFSSQIFQLNEGDNIYMFSDGYVDQFGGPLNRKFMSLQFKTLLKSLSSRSLVEQENILGRVLNDWKGLNEQVDDILVLGIKV